MSSVKPLLDTLLWDIYGKQCDISRRRRRNGSNTSKFDSVAESDGEMNLHGNAATLEKISVCKLIDITAIIKVEILLMGHILERALIHRDRKRRRQEELCAFVETLLRVRCCDVEHRMRFSLAPPPPKASAAVTFSSDVYSVYPAKAAIGYGGFEGYSGDRTDDMSVATTSAMTDEVTSDYSQWLHAMKLVARLPGGMPPEFRRKLWLSLADKYLRSKNVDWKKQEEKCFCEEWREDDEELGVQIVKDLHRTGSNICTGPSGTINQAKLKRILLGYARYNPEVGYCQGFNMLGALILQVMDKEEAESMKVMIYLVEGVLPTGYFCGSMGGLQADMGVFRELMQTTQPRLAKHLQKLQGPVENAYEPPLTNVFTMQWFLTMFCTCLPTSCVLRVWDLVLIEGSDVLLRTALVLWSLLEERVLKSRTADDFYCKMGSFSSELLNGHLIDSNGLIEKVVQLGPIPDIQKIRDKHLYNIAPLHSPQELHLYFNEEEMESDEDSRLAVATVWGIPWGRRGSHGQPAVVKQTAENKDRIALDISLLKKQYDRLRERQKQAHVILTNACSTARQGPVPVANPLNPQHSIPVSQLLVGRSAIVTNKGRRIGPPPGTIPPARKPSLPTVLQTKPPEKQLRRGETLHWRDTDLSKRRRDSLTWKEIKADRATISNQSVEVSTTQKLRSRVGKSDSSSYSEEESDNDDDRSSTDTSLCDEDDPHSLGNKTQSTSNENSPRKRSKVSRKQRDVPKRLHTLVTSRDSSKERKRPKSWAPSSEIPFVLMTSDSMYNADEKKFGDDNSEAIMKEEEDSTTECDRLSYRRAIDLDWSDTKPSPTCDVLQNSQLTDLHSQTIDVTVSTAISTGELSPMPYISSYLNSVTVSPLPTSKPLLLASTNSLGSGDGDGDDAKKFDVSDDGVTNEYFERVNSVERPTKLELYFSLNEEDGIRTEFEDSVKEPCDDDNATIDILISSSNVDVVNDLHNTDDDEVHETQETLPIIITSNNTNRCMELLIDYSEKSSAAFIAQATNELSISLNREKNPCDIEESCKNECLYRESKVPEETCSEIQTIENEKSAENPCETCDNNLICNEEKPTNQRFLTHTSAPLIDIEKTVQSLKKQLRSDNKINDVVHSKTSFEVIQKEMVSSSGNGRIIPSTEDLEERFNTLERQQSLGKYVCKHSELNDVVLNKHESPISKSNQHSKTNSKRNKIPSTADLESRFDALERQMSSSSTTPITSIERNDNDRGEDSTTKSDEVSSNKSTEKQSEKQEAQSNTQIKTNDPSSESTEKSDRPQLRKLPSAAELEDRFNALEREKCLQNNPPFKSKKEPPDVIKQQNRNEIGLDGKNLNTHSTQEASKVSGVHDKELDTFLESDSLKTEELTTERKKKKDPPSTEELERRYNALEKQLSAAALESSKTPQKNRPSSTSNKTDTNRNCNTYDEASDAADTTPEITRKSSGNLEEKDSENKKLMLAERASHSKRRASEPPSTEDLERRYECLKRRMSSKAVNEKSISISETVQEALERIEKDIQIDICKVRSDEETKKKLPDEISDSKKENPEKLTLCDNIGELERQKCTPKESITEFRHDSDKENLDCELQNQTDSSIPAAPPMPLTAATQPRKENLIITDATHRALIEELQTKIKVQENNENLKPSEMNSRRKHMQLQRTALTDDGTSETHADTAFNRSEKYEPSQMLHKKIMSVRRFSDLPSRSDLENRLYFLEAQLNTTFYKQRCASDSEVASRRYFSEKDQNTDKPSTSFAQQRTSDELERRIQALEKQLSDNSLKISHAHEKKEDIASPKELPQILSTETIDASGHELVRYTHVNQLEETDTNKPINISINIKMLMNKENQKQKTDSLLSAASLEKRVEAIEKHLDASKEKESANDRPNEINLAEDLTEIINQVDLSKELPHVNEDKTNAVNTAESDNQIITESNELQNDEKDQDIKMVDAKENEFITNEVDSNHEEVQNIAKQNTSLDLSEKNHPQNTNEKLDDKNSSNTQDVVQNDQPESSTCADIACSSVESPQNINIDESNIESTDPKNKTLVLLLDNEPKAVKVRRLTRANTEELIDLFQAVEKQIADRNLIKSDDGKLIHGNKQETEHEKLSQTTKGITDLTTEINKFTSGEAEEIKSKENENYDWGSDPVKRHLKRKTAYLPSTKELEARFRSLERQIKLLEGVEIIDVDKRMKEIERKIKLQHSLSHEKDLNKFLELCEGRGLEDTEEYSDQPESSHKSTAQKKLQSPYTSPSRAKAKSPYTSPLRSKSVSPHTSPTRSIARKSPYTSPSRSSQYGQQSSVHRQMHNDDIIPSIEDLQYRYRSFESKSKEPFKRNTRKNFETTNKPIHPLEMLLDPSPEEDTIPTTGELEHRMKVLDENRTQKSHQRKSRSHSPIKRELPTTDELEARVRALENEHCFDIKMQNNFKEFNQKLKDVVSPSLSFEEFQSSKSTEESPRRCDITRSITPRSVLWDSDVNPNHSHYRSTSPKVIRFRDDEEYRPKSNAGHRNTERTVGKADGVMKTIQENSEMLRRILKKTLTDSNISYGSNTAIAEGLDALGTRFMRETSPLQRTGTHTGVPLRTNDNINERLTSIKNSIKSIDSLCEEKPYRKEKCQRYIDSLFSDSVHFSQKKASVEDLVKNDSRTHRDYTPSIRVSHTDHTQRPSEYFLSRSTGSVESMHSTSPLRSTSPLHHRSNRDLCRDTSPRWRRNEEREEYESRVRRDNILPKYSPNDISELSRDSLTKFYKVDRQQDTDKYDERVRSSSSRSASRSPLRSPYGSRETMMLHNTTANTMTTEHNRRLDLDRPVSPYRQTSHYLLGHDPLKRTNTPVYSPAKLEIRHTTVTSTFYDRLLTEKQIEKNFSRPSSSSPLISPSVTSKSYLDVPIVNGSCNSQMSKDSSPTTTYAKNICGAYNLKPSVPSKSFGFSNDTENTSTYTAAVGIVPYTTFLNSAKNTIQYSATTPPGNSSTYQTAKALTSVLDDPQTKIGISSCDNILMEMKSICTTTAGSGSVVTATSSTTAASAVHISATASATITTPSNYISSSYNTYPIASSYNPLMPLTSQQSSILSGSLTYNMKTLDTNYGTVSMPSSSANSRSS